MKRGIKLLILLGVCAVAVGGYLLLKSADWGSEDGTAETGEKVVLADKATEEISGLTWIYDGETYSLTQDANGVWSDPDDAALPVDQDKAVRMASAVASLKSDREITGVEDLAQYGLESPALSVTVFYTDGTNAEYTFGDTNAVTGDIYAGANGNVYTLDASVPEEFQTTSWDLIASEKIPAMDSPLELDLQTASGALQVKKLADSGLAYTGDYVWFVPEGTEYRAADSESVQSLISSLTGLDLSTVAAYNVTAEELSQWGLDKPAGSVSVRYTTDDGEKTFTLELGEYSGESCYARIQDSSMVYLIDAATADSFLLASYDGSLRPNEVCLIDIDTIQSMDIALNGKTYTVEVGEKAAETDAAETTAAPAATATPETTAAAEATATYTCGGTELDYSAFRSVLATIHSMTATATNGNPDNAGSEVLSLTYHRDAGEWSDMTLTFRRYDSSSYLVEFNGWDYMLCSKSAVDGLAEDLSGLLAP